jgi:ABC-type multidrug transport system ATPase subunit
MWSISPRSWTNRIALTTAGAICSASSTFAFSQTLALIGESSAESSALLALGAATAIGGWFVGSIGMWYASRFIDYRSDVLAARHANEVDLTIDRSIKETVGNLPEEIRQRQDIAELCGLVECHEDSSKDLVTGIIRLSQECIEFAVTAGAVLVCGGGFGILPVACGGYLKYRSSKRIADAEVESEQRAAELDLLYVDGDRVLSTNAAISNLQTAHSHDRVVDRVMQWKKNAADMRLDALSKNERREFLTDTLLEIPVAGSCVYFMAQWLAGDMGAATCIWLMMSIWSLRSNINEMGSLLSRQATDLKLASHRHALLDITEEIGDGRKQVSLTEAPAISLHDVRLRRPGSTRDTLKKTSLEIPAGTSVGIIGNYGQGKSSFIGLILGRILPTSGNVCVGGHSTKEASVLTGSLNQDFSLIPGLTVRENIELFRPLTGGLSAEEAVAILGVEEELFENKPHAYDTIIPGKNQKGTNFSGGQLQLIALARALSAGSRLLVLDEPLSALGPSIQSKIHKAIFALQPTPTLVIVTHKLEQIGSCSNVIVIDRGEVVESGAPDELLKKRGGRLRKLARDQHQISGRKKTPPVTPTHVQGLAAQNDGESPAKSQELKD